MKYSIFIYENACHVKRLSNEEKRKKKKEEEKEEKKKMEKYPGYTASVPRRHNDRW